MSCLSVCMYVCMSVSLSHVGSESAEELMTKYDVTGFTITLRRPDSLICIVTGLDD